MAEEVIPRAVGAFIERYISSVEQLEILLLLSSDPAQEFTVERVYEKIMSTKPSVAAWLEKFVEQKLARRSEVSPYRYAFHPAEPELLDTAQALAATYRARPVRVLEFIYQKPSRPPQGADENQDPAQGFADAFRLRKK